METSDYEYKGLIAASWDLLRGDTSNWPDRKFYREAILKSGQPALDVGCGTGRLLLDYLSSGIDIDGVDNSPEMLELCQAKAQAISLAPALYLQAMQSLDLPRRYRTILVPSSSFQLVTDSQDAAQAMKRFYQHLEPGGVLAMPFMILYSEDAGEAVQVQEDWEMAAEQPRPEDGALVRRWTRSRFDLTNQLEHTEDRYEVVRDGQVIASEYHARSPATRWYTQDQAARLFQDAGFEQLFLTGGFHWEAASPQDTFFCVLGARPIGPS
jgi:SAM-dependent methyltransferase